jgi:GRAM domain
MTKKTMAIALAFGLPWSMLMIIFYSIIDFGLTPELITSTLIGGLVSGLLFALMIQYFAKWSFKKIKVDIGEDEHVIKETGANHFKGREGVGGKLVLTNKQLIFKSHSFNIQNHQENFGLIKIKSVEATKTLGILKNRLTVQLITHETHKFIADNPGEWVEAITHQKSLGNL